MAIYHCSIKIGSRAKGQSAVAAAAYRSGDKLKDNETGLLSDYSRKGGVVFSEISLCENAPAEYADRATLWNSVHKIEKAKNAQLWREFEVALPKEFSRAEQINTVREFVKVLNGQGMCVDWSIHDKEDGNPHAHIMATMRSITEDGKWAPKSRKVYDLDENGERISQKADKSGRKQYKNHKEDYNDWNKRERVEEWRAAWAACCNAGLAERNRIDHRSYERQGIEQEPTIHEGYVARKMAKEGKSSERILINQEIRAKNDMLRKLTIQQEETERQIAELIKEKGNTINAGKQRIADLLDRRNRKADNDVRGTADGDRAVSGRVKKIAPSESDLLIRQSKAERRTAIINAGLSEVRATEQEPANESATVGTAIERGRAALDHAATIRRAAEIELAHARTELDHSRAATAHTAANRAIGSTEYGLRRWADIQNMKEARKVINILTEYGMNDRIELENLVLAKMNEVEMMNAKLSALDTQIQDLSQAIELIQTRKRYLPIVKEWKGLSGRKRTKFENEHFDELTAQKNVIAKLRELYPNAKLPKLETLENEKTALTEERSKLNEVYKAVCADSDKLNYAKQALEEYWREGDTEEQSAVVEGKNSVESVAKKNKHRSTFGINRDNVKKRIQSYQQEHESDKTKEPRNKNKGFGLGD